MIVKKLLILAPLSMLIACDWVDSTGRESNSTPVTQITFADGQRTDASSLNELSSLNFSVSAEDADGEINRYEWRPDPVEQGALNQCAGVAGFDLAADSLEEACSPTADCAVTIEELQADGDSVDFMIRAPELRAPIGVTYQLDAIDNDGGTGTQQSTFCLIAINEAPEAVDDSFTIIEGGILKVSAQAGQINLLSNDVQDDHVANKELRVDPDLESEPLLASSFTHDSVGGFVYTASQIPDRRADSVIDTFVYTITDGTHTSSATVTVNVVAANDAPEQSGPIPLQEVVAGIEFKSDLSTYFTDAEGSMLSFVVSDGALPASGALSLSANGTLSGTAEQFDKGSYTIEIIASDGSKQIKSELSIDILENSPVAATAIRTQANELGEVLEIDLSNFFVDPEGIPLTYTVNNPYSTATIDLDIDTGELEAVFTNVGRYFIDVYANDGISTPTNMRITVIVSTDNVAPQFLETIVNRNAIVDRIFAPVNVAASFSDANDDELTFEAIGTLPDGITLSSTGILFGTPTEDGFFTGIRIVATDPLDESAQSNFFRIRVFPPLAVPTAALEGTVDK